MCVNEDKILRMKDLIKALTEADIAYYRDDDPVMSDREYDQLTDELLKLEAETGLVISGSPTQKVSGEVLEELTSVRHTKPMLSAKKTKSIEEMVRFAGGRSVLVSWKLDGLTIVLRYENGELKQSITRGREGTVGEDVTHTVRTYLNVPLTIPIRDSIEVRGEGVISWRHFNLINSDLEDTYSHPRNLAAGSTRKLDANESRKVHKEAVIIAACKQRQQILVFHMYPDGLILQPSPWECPGPAHLETDILQRFIQFIHIQSPVQQRAVPDFICHTAFRRLRLPGTPPAGRPLQEKRKRRFSHFPGQYSGFHRSDAFCLIVEIGRTDSAVFFRFSCYGLPERRGQAVQNIGSFLCPESRPSAGETVLHLRSVPVAEPIPLHPLFIGGLMRLFQAVQGLQQVGNFFVHLYLIRENPLPFQQKI